MLLVNEDSHFVSPRFVHIISKTKTSPGRSWGCFCFCFCPFFLSEQALASSSGSVRSLSLVPVSWELLPAKAHVGAVCPVYSTAGRLLDIWLI